MHPGIYIGIAALVIGLPLAIVGVRLAYINQPSTPGRRRGILIAALGLGVIWVGGFVGAFSSLTA